jgi:hypothetical protein
VCGARGQLVVCAFVVGGVRDVGGMVVESSTKVSIMVLEVFADCVGDGVGEG